METDTSWRGEEFDELLVSIILWTYFLGEYQCPLTVC